MVLSGSDSTEMRRGNSGSPCNIPHFTGVFLRVFHIRSPAYFINSRIGLITFVLTPNGSIALNRQE